MFGRRIRSLLCTYSYHGNMPKFNYFYIIEYGINCSCLYTKIKTVLSVKCPFPFTKHTNLQQQIFIKPLQCKSYILYKHEFHMIVIWATQHLTYDCNIGECPKPGVANPWPRTIKTSVHYMNKHARKRQVGGCVVSISVYTPLIISVFYLLY